MADGWMRLLTFASMSFQLILFYNFKIVCKIGYPQPLLRVYHHEVNKNPLLGLKNIVRQN